MKPTIMRLSYIFLISILFSCSQTTVDCYVIKNENGIYYIDDNKTPYTGNCVMYHLNGKKSFEAEYKNGYSCGESKWYYENGQISQQITYILDEENIPRPDGKHTKWFENGNIREVVNYKEGNYEGEWYQLDTNGEVLKKGSYKANKLINGDKHIMPEM
jgi:antitoxin component YwqK of YwqJK toxin-antitoxin module